MNSLVNSDPDPAFLGVERSVTGKRWADRLDAAGRRRAQTLMQRYAWPDLIARIVAGRVQALDDAADYLDPTLKSLMPDPSVLVGMDEAVDRLVRAVQNQEKVAVFGDYDVDGATASALLTRFLRAAGLDPEIYIPDRIFEGYGPNPAALEALSGAGYTLVVTVDCGMTSYAALQRAVEIGLDIVVIDHHQPGPQTPAAVAVVNPNRADDVSGLGSLAAVGVTFLFCVAVNRVLRAAGRPAVPPDNLLEWLPLVALGTVCDVVPLIGLNRAFAAKGLQAMARRRIPGLRALSDVARLNGPPTAYHLGFLLGPRINAGGRIGQADLGARLLTIEDEVTARTIAEELDRLNCERQAIEATMLEDAIAEAEAAMGASGSVPVLLSSRSGWHPGIVGLVAARLKERFHRPSFAIAVDGTSGTGSARSIPGVDIGKAVREAVEAGILIKGGGHMMAAGFTIDAGNVGAFRAYLEDSLRDQVDNASARDRLALDGALTAAGAQPELVEAIERAGPFGAGNPEPCFAFPAHNVRNAMTVGAGGAHVKCRLIGGDGKGLDAIAFRSGGTPLGEALLAAGGSAQSVHVAGVLRIDRWGGRQRLQLQVRDAADPQTCDRR